MIPEELLQNPDLLPRYLRRIVSPADWNTLVGKYPHLAVYCPEPGIEWCRILSEDPRYIETAPQEEIDKLTGNDWCWILSLAPHDSIGDKCDFFLLNGWDWSRLLCADEFWQTECFWEKLSLSL